MSRLDQHGIAERTETRQMVEVWRIEDHTQHPVQAFGQQMPEAW
jgi:hypothetical protein